MIQRVRAHTEQAKSSKQKVTHSANTASRRQTKSKQRVVSSVSIVARGQKHKRYRPIHSNERTDGTGADWQEAKV